MPTTLNWKIISVLGRTISSEEDLSTIAFTAQPSPRIFSQFALPLDHAYIPLALLPTPTYYQSLRNYLQSLGLAPPIGKFPFSIAIPQLGQSRLIVQTRVYPPNILALTVRLGLPSDVAIDTDFAQLLSLRSHGSVALLRELVSFTAGVIDSADHRRLNTSMRVRVYPAYRLTPVDRGSDMPQYVAGERARLVALLLGVRQPTTVDELLIHKTLERSAELNRKSSAESLLLNKQGIIYLTPRGDYDPSELNRFRRAADLAEIGLVFQQFLDHYLSSRREEENFVDYIFTQIQAWVRHPSAIFAASYTNDLIWNILMEALRLEEKLELIERRYPSIIQDVEEKGSIFATAADRWWQKARFARSFDGIVGRASSILGRIADQTLRLSIIDDLKEAETSLDSKNFKASVVMSGAAVEAMLLAILEQDATIPPVSLHNGNLHRYIELVKGNGLIRDMTLLDLLDNYLREWRNLVHPGRSRRTGVSLTERHAEICLSAAKALADVLV